MMSNTGATTFGNALQQHNLTAATIDYLNHNAPPTMAPYPNVTTTESGLVLDKPTPATTYYAPAPNPAAYYSTQLVTQAPGTILITNSFGPDESSTISGVNNSFTNSSIRIVTHNNNNNNNNHTNNNNNSNCDILTKLPSLEEASFDKQPHQYHSLHHLHHPPSTMQTIAVQHSPSSSSSSTSSSVTSATLTSLPNPVINMPNPLVTTGPSSAGPPTNTSTVVLDRINICINNHYGDTATALQNAALHSPIIPPIVSQQTTIIDTCAPMMKQVVDTVAANINNNNNNNNNLDMHIDEPDSTTSTHCNSDLAPMEQDNPVVEPEGEEQDVDMEKNNSFDEEIATTSFEIGEDALVKRRDGRYYLGTIVNKHRQQYLMQFDDKTDYWSNVDELTKLSDNSQSKTKARCLTCKVNKDDDVVETCDRCGRGYHRLCTDEVSPNSGQYMCKRCAKPMKYSCSDEDQTVKTEKQKTKESKVIKQLPYDLDELTWDDKHRVNVEKIYCYCGKSGQFDNKMIQCCKCKQWFHADCVQSQSLQSIFRGDVFYLFGCLLCNNGKEFLRRIEIKWVELVHLLLYNMSIMKNFQKYHHLHKEIYPFALQHREALQLPKSILDLTETEYKNEILKTLQDNPKIFICGRELKKEFAVWSLRVIKPPQGPAVAIEKDEVLCNKMIAEKLKINILPFIEGDEKMETDHEVKQDDGEEVDKDKRTEKSKPKSSSKSNFKADEVDDDDDDKFTSDDEIPIKQILEQVKSESTNMQDLSDPLTELLDQIIPTETSAEPSKECKNEKISKNEQNETTKPQQQQQQQQKSSRKRKAFTLSKGYEDSEKSSSSLIRNICDSSSDENSSSSRGTLDLIIPPPKNFLGLNNPFRMITPKKSEQTATGTTNLSSNKNNSGLTKKSVSFGTNSIFTSTLDLNSKIAALKSSGLFPNISNSDIAKAAGQPRLVRTIKRRLSAKDIMIGPNQEVRRRRTRPLSSNVEVISTTTINQIPSNFFPIRAPIPEALLNNPSTISSSKSTTTASQPSTSPNNTSSSLDSVPSVAVATHGRRLRKRPDKISPQNSRRNSISSSSSSNSYNGGGASSLVPGTVSVSSQSQSAVPMTDLKQSVNRYFGAANRIENGEQFTIRARRRTPTGHTQYLIEWES